MINPTCGNCKFMAELYGEKDGWLARYCRHSAPPFPKAPGWCGEHQFDVDKLLAEKDSTIEHLSDSFLNERATRWVEKGKPEIGEVSGPFVSPEDRAEFKEKNAAFWEGLDK